jgi:NAD(P)-dependent dehydrogenase (short-subunit alcohol dehydrogenase family)
MSEKISKAVLITGCSTGIGRATAEHLATARDVGSIDDLKTKGCRTLTLDVCSETSMRDAVAAVEKQEGAVGVLVNNAGYGQEGTIEEVPLDEVRRQFETNVFGLTRMSQLVLPGMRRQGWGKIVNLSSMGGRLTLPGGGFYHATKHAVESLSDAMRFEVRPFGIDVIVVQPGPIKTRFGDTAVSAIKRIERNQSPYAGLNERVARNIIDAYEGPMARLAAGPEAVAAVIERAISASRPKTRYPVTMAARTLMALRRWLPDSAFDAFLRSQYGGRGSAR